MPLPHWLRPLFPARADAPLNTAEPATPPQDQGISIAEPPPDNAVRAHLAANDPNFPAQREAAMATITHEVNTIAQRHGFIAKPKSWAKTGPLGTVTITIHRSPYGFEAYVDLGFQPEGAAHGPWAQDDVIRLGQFYPDDAADADDRGALIYVDIVEGSTALSDAMQVLDRRALPWLVAHLTDDAAWQVPLR